ncbi:hypothetical protein ACRWQL_10730 [Shewanella sp. HL-SH4]|uniref:hypothetical protein n=1 Tax=Shewanella sp. HL-SH4 TaxID=3436240 RepID=UPI003EB71F58
MKKWILIVSVLLSSLLLTACTSNSGVNAACDFVDGATASKSQTQHKTPGEPDYEKEVPQEFNPFMGGATAIVGFIFRPLFGDDECD